MRRPIRLLLVALLALGLAPGTWWRSPIPPPAFDGQLEVAELIDPPGFSGLLELTGAWQLDHANPFFGGFSALTWMGGAHFLAGSDRALLLHFTVPGASPARASMQPLAASEARATEDLEAIARDRTTGQMWFAFERENLVERHDPGGRILDVAPTAMSGWPSNGGAETLAKLADGRFLVIRESRSDTGGNAHPALLFDADPVTGGEPMAFAVATPADYRPVDAAQLPDGRAIILLRRLVSVWPAQFATALLVADPAQIEAGGIWSGKVVTRIGGPGLADNFEGLAVVPRGPSGAAELYLVSDNNFSPMQRTILLRIAWPATR
ncbi:MAG: esterase-like activity of phytase family protein [Erythrobacter sp.]